MDAYTEAKSMRLLCMYSRLLDGKTLRKRELAEEFGIALRSVQRDLESLRIFFAEEMLGREILYDPKERGYRLSHASQRGLTDSEILAVCKILLESRSMCREEMMPILDKLVECCVPDSSRKAVTSLLANERHHYVEPRHGKSILDGLWEIGQAIERHQVMELEYRKMDGSVTERPVEPVGLMFSEYYFYLVAFLHNDPRTDRYRQNNTLLPTIYRIDRIQFMFGGKLNRVRFKYTGPSLEAVLDRLPTAQILSQDEEGWEIEVEVFGKGIEMWLRGQGEYVKYELYA